MLTSMIIEGILKLVWVRKDSNKQKSVMRFYGLNDTVPEKVLNETIPGSGIFRDKESHTRYQFKNNRIAAI